MSVAKLHAGSATRSDSLRSLVTLGNTRLDLIQAQTDLATAEASLARLVGEIGRVRALDDSSFHQVVPAVDTQALRTEAEARSPRIQSALAAHDVARANVRAARSAYWPSLTLGANTGWNASRANDYAFFNQRQVSLQLSWSIFQPVRPRAHHRPARGELRRRRGHRRGRAAGGAGGAHRRGWPSSTPRAPRSTSRGPASRPPPRTCACSRSATGSASRPSWTC